RSCGWTIRSQIAFAFACEFSTDNVRLGLQRPSTQDDELPRAAHPAAGDPGSKGRRVAWTTSRGEGRRETEGTHAIASPLHRSPRSAELGGGRCPIALRDRLTGRTPRSERGDRGSTPCPGTARHTGE